MGRYLKPAEALTCVRSGVRFLVPRELDIASNLDCILDRVVDTVLKH